MSMRRRVIIIAIALLVAIALFAAVRIADSTADNREREASTELFNGIVAEVGSDGACEVLVDLGIVPYSSTTTQCIRLINNSSEPLVLVDYTTQCRCMWLDFERKPIEVGASSDVVLTFDSRGEWGSVGNYMEIATSHEDCPIVLWIGAEVE